MKKKAFTLIELIALLVILAILALIVTPLVMNIIRKARISADKRSIDAYGKSIELAIASYLIDEGKFPTDMSQLSIEYTGDEVVCTTTQLNSDSSVYLSGCTVAGRNVDGYTYGKEEVITYDAYSVGNEVTYNNVDYYVIKDSSTFESTVTLLKAEPLSYEEVQIYSEGTGAQTSNENGYGGMKYHSESRDYSNSYVKNTVDAWASANVPVAIETRLITFDELVDNLGYEQDQTVVTMMRPNQANTPSWVYNNQYYYYTMSPAADNFREDSIIVYSVSKFGYLIYSDNPYDGTGGFGVVRPVIVLPKTALN